MSAMIVNGLKFNCLARWSLMQAKDSSKAESWHDIEHAMQQGNTSVTDMYLGPYFYSNLTAHELRLFLEQCANHLHNLKTLSIGTLEFTKTTIPGPCLGQAFLPHAQQLHTLRIERHLELRDGHAVQQLADGFYQHPTLKRISLPSLHPMTLLDHDDPKASPALDPLLEALSTITGLESLQLGLSDSSWQGRQPHQDCDNDNIVTSPQVLGRLGTLPHLSWLVLSRFHVQDAHVCELCHTIMDLQAEHCQQFDNSRRHGHCGVGGGGGSGVGAAPLKIVDLTKSTRGVTVTAWQCVLRLLEETHVHLETMDMYCPGTRQAVWYKSQAQLYLKLNREGRRRKLRDCLDKEQWISTVSKFGFAKDLTMLHVLMRESPWMCFPNA